MTVRDREPVRLERRFVHAGESVRLARHWLEAELYDHTELSLFEREDAVLALSELVTNAFRHAVTDATVTLVLQPRSAQIEVTDDGPGRPEAQPFEPGRPGGHGLRIVREVSDEWGTHFNGPSSKTVWFVVHAKDGQGVS